jgi:sarcosine oxidase
MRIVIVGVGGVGAMAAWRLSHTEHEVIALEQFRLDHDRGSSYGDSRIVRNVYPDTLYTALMTDAYKLWDDLMEEAQDRQLFVQSGGIYCGPADDARVLAAQEALAASRVPYEVLLPAECAVKFPEFPLREEEVAVYEPSMGYARASHCVKTAAKIAQQRGAQIREATSVVGIEAGKDGFAARLTLASGETINADRLLLCVGSWAGPLLESLGVSVPFNVTRQPYVHLKVPENAPDFSPGHFPVWIDALANAYGFPQLGDAPGIKIGIHDHGPTVTPEAVEREITEADREAVRRYAAQRFTSAVGKEVTYEKVCLYTNTPDEDFIIDSIPGLDGVFVISACSGHGFKFTPLMGQIAADLLTDTPLPYDLSRFRLARFTEPFYTPETRGF